MRKAMMVGMMALAGTGACAGKDARRASYEVRVYLENRQIVDRLLLSRAEALAGSMFAGIGIDLRWKIGVPRVGRPKAGCPSRPEVEVVVRLATNTPAGFYPGAPAYSLPYAPSGVRVTVFYDRVLSSLGGNTTEDAVFLGHILAHEITHVLQGMARHSAEGLMKAHWSALDREQMRRRPLAFAGEDVELIRQALDHRSGRTEVAGRAIQQAGPVGPGQ